MTTTDTADRRAGLLALKLGALVRDHAGEPGEVSGFGGGAGALVDGTAWVLVDERPERGLGPALAWAIRHGAARVHVMADHGTGQMARRAEQFGFPIVVSHIEGRTLIPAVGEPLTPPPAAPDTHRALIPLIVAGGADPVEEHGIVAGEVRGLEVCRVVPDSLTGEPRLEVGIGAHDRETFQALHGARPVVEGLADVVRIVAAQRVPGAAPHPLNLLAASRLLRARLMDEPGLIGAGAVRPAQPPMARTNLKDPAPCVALADVDDDPVVVVCTTGIDLDVVPYAVDALDAHAGARCIVVTPARDAIGLQHELAALVRRPIEVRGLHATAGV